MLRYKTETIPGLVALYDIWPGNGAGPFLQPRSPHGASDLIWCTTKNAAATNVTPTMSLPQFMLPERHLAVCRQYTKNAICLLIN